MEEARSTLRRSEDTTGVKASRDEMAEGKGGGSEVDKEKKRASEDTTGAKADSAVTADNRQTVNEEAAKTATVPEMVVTTTKAVCDDTADVAMTADADRLDQKFRDDTDTDTLRGPESIPILILIL